MRNLILLLFFLSHNAFSNLISNETTQNISEFKLNNGLRIIVKIDNRAPVFISQLWYKVGSSDEPEKITGISHMLEHMMFKGTSTYKVGDFYRIIAKNGGSLNAFTSADYTAYYQKMHRSKLALAIKMEADRMRNLTFSNVELQTEKQVVIEERRLRVDDNPNAQAYENLSLISFAAKGAYYAPIIGFKTDIENYKLSDVRQWYEKYYAPNNAILVVVGDVKLNKVLEYAQKYFGGYKKNLTIPNNLKILPIAFFNKTKTLKIKAQLPFYTLGFHVPSLKTAHHKTTAYQLNMLAYVLNNHLAKTLLRRQQIVSNISVSYYLYSKYNTLFVISFTPAKGVKSQHVLTNIKSQLASFVSKPSLIKSQLNNVKTQLEADFIFSQDQIATQSYYLGMLASIGLNPNNVLNHINKMKQTNSKSLIDIIKKYLDFNNANTVEIIPQGI